jgi:glycosyltransferase involved in cell wall biosynthesis
VDAPRRAGGERAHQQAPAGLSDPPVYVIGARWRHHARHSGYERFADHTGIRLKQVRLPLVPGRRGRRAEAQRTAAMARAHMRTSLGATYHVIYADRDLRMVAAEARRHGIRLIATFHNPPVELALDPPDEHIRKGIAAAILVSESQREYFAGLLPPERVFVVPHGIDTTFFRPAARRRHGGEGHLITVGAKYRDWDTLNEALALLWRDRPRLRLVAVGAPGEEGSRLRRLGRGRVRTVRHVGDRRLRAAYTRARAAVLPLLEATANNSVLEAMACGAPLVASDVGAIREYTGDRGAVLVPPQDPSALAEAVSRLLDDDALAQRTAAAARERALEYDYAAVARAIERVYAEVAMLTAPPRATEPSA